MALSPLTSSGPSDEAFPLHLSTQCKLLCFWSWGNELAIPWIITRLTGSQRPSRCPPLVVVIGSSIVGDVVVVEASLFETCCVSCGHVAVNQGSPICAALEGKGSTDPDTSDAKIPSEELPRCERRDCHALLRLNVTWFGETLDLHVLTKVETVLDTCDLCLVVSRPDQGGDSTGHL
eukprot:XP_013995932.1 PREDICTED: NAD-dependent protein deacylase sirtuin-5, mitochondrial-like [Salmo salar]